MKVHLPFWCLFIFDLTLFWLKFSKANFRGLLVNRDSVNRKNNLSSIFLQNKIKAAMKSTFWLLNYVHRWGPGVGIPHLPMGELKENVFLKGANWAAFSFPRPRFIFLDLEICGGFFLLLVPRGSWAAGDQAGGSGGGPGWGPHASRASEVQGAWAFGRVRWVGFFRATPGPCERDPVREAAPTQVSTRRAGPRARPLSGGPLSLILPTRQVLRWATPLAFSPAGSCSGFGLAWGGRTLRRKGSERGAGATAFA